MIDLPIHTCLDFRTTFKTKGAVTTYIQYFRQRKVFTVAVGSLTYRNSWPMGIPKSVIPRGEHYAFLW
jgi:hypothetical protein